jgi:hypothetical protein
MAEVTLDRLYRASKLVDLPGGGQMMMRALSDAERQQIELDSLAAAMSFDRRIKDPDSSEYLSYIYPLEEASTDVLIDVLCAWRKGEAEGEAAREIKDEFIAFPKDASIEEKKDVLRQREEYETVVSAKRRLYVENAVKAAREKFAQLEEAKLRSEAKFRKIQYMSAAEAYSTRLKRAVFYGAEKLDGGRFFESFSDVKELDSTFLAFLYQEQKEVDSLDPWAVIKIRAGRESVGLVADEKDDGQPGESDSLVVGIRDKPAETSGRDDGTIQPAPGQGAPTKVHVARRGRHKRVA